MLPTQYDNRTSVNREQVMEFFGISTNTVTKWIKQGKLPMPVHMGKEDKWRYVDILLSYDRMFDAGLKNLRKRVA